MVVTCNLVQSMVTIDVGKLESFILEKIAKTLEIVALESVDLEPDNIPAMGKMINALSSILDEGKELLPSIFLTLTGTLQGYVEQMSLGEEKDPSPVKEAISCLQRMLRAIERADEIEEDDAKKISQILGGNFEHTLDEPKDKEIKGVEDLKTDSNPEQLSEEDIELLQDFVSEALDSLSTIEVGLVDLEHSPDDIEIINSIFRPFHTIKGVSGFLNLQKINKLAHCSENLLDKARSGEIRIDDHITDLILESVDRLKELIEVVQDNIGSGRPLEGDIDCGDLIHRIQETVARSNEIAKKPLGEILVADGAVSKEEVDQALEEQRQKPEKKVGEVLLEKGAVKPRAVASALRKQKKYGGGQGAEEARGVPVRHRHGADARAPLPGGGQP